MSDRAFVDTNVLVYTISTDPVRRDAARAVIEEASEVVLSAQVLSEFVNVSLRKSLLAHEEVQSVLDQFLRAYEVVPVEGESIRRALDLQRRYRFSWWDSVVLASALQFNCSLIYTEDLKHDQVIEGRLLIRNPFQSP